DDYRDLELTGGEAAVPIWADFINRALALRPDLNATKFKQPDGLEVVEIDPETGMLANQFCPRRLRILLANYMRPEECFTHQAPVFTNANVRPDPLLQPISEEDEDVLEGTFVPAPERIRNPPK